MTVRRLADVMETIAPLRYAESWDNVGLLVGDPEAALRGPVLLTIDLTERVLGEAVERKASAVVAYHPPIWEPLARLTTERAQQRIVLRAIGAGLAIYSPHTALDAAHGGLTDWLCEGLSGGVGRIAGDCRALSPHLGLEAHQQVKIVTFVPRKDVEAVRNALASSGAGLIGRYEICSFAAEGTGTFLGGAGSSPAVGEAGRLERVPEDRLEMVCSNAALALALATLRRFHPYEEPAVDVYPLAPKPERDAGAGRRLVLDQPATLGELATRLKMFLGVSVVRLAPAAEGWEERPITRIGVCPGAGASLAAGAVGAGCEVFVTGEMKHHEVLATLHAGTSVLLAGHTNTERGYLPRLARRLADELRGVSVVVSSADRDPLLTV